VVLLREAEELEASVPEGNSLSASTAVPEEPLGCFGFLPRAMRAKSTILYALDGVYVDNSTSMESLLIPLIAVLDDVRSLHNVGAVFRTADALGLEAVWLCGITGRPPHRDLRKTALGAEESVSWRYFPSRSEALHALQERGALSLVLEQHQDSRPLQDFIPAPQQAYGLWVGHEVYGVNNLVVESAAAVLEIPQFGAKRSLNVSVAAGVALWELSLKMR
jgi:23S rRNA (guanosine2251-2'-O)-methyltransferase